MRSENRRWLLVLLASCSIACAPPQSGEDDDEAGTSDTIGGDPTPWNTYAEAECAAYVDCGCSEPMGLAADLEACIETRRQVFGLIAEVGSFEWDPSCAQARLELIAASCQFGQTECAGQQCSLFVGSSDVGEACTTIDDPLGRPDVAPCMAGLACRSGACAGYDCNPLACEAGGGWCPAQSQCFCDDLGPCACKADVGEGEGCEENFGPACVAGLVCSDGICAMPGQVGQACVGDFCVPGAYCDFDTLTCVAQGQPGDPCGEAWECLSGGCAGTCSEFAGEGEPCAPPTCIEGLDCLFIEALGALGCVASKQPGEPCEAVGQCQGSTCVAGICQAGACEGL